MVCQASVKKRDSYYTCALLAITMSPRVVIGINIVLQAPIKDQSIILIFLPIFLSSNSFFSDLLCQNFCLKIHYFAQSQATYIDSCLTVASYTLYTPTTYAHHGEL